MEALSGFYGGNMLERRPKKKAIIKLASMEVGGDIGELVRLDNEETAR